MQQQYETLSRQIVTGKIKAANVARWGGDVPLKPQPPQMVTINLDEASRKITAALNNLDQLTKQGENTEDERFSSKTAANSNNAGARTEERRRSGEIISSNRLKPNLKISGYVKNALTKHGVPDMSASNLASWRDRSEMFLHSDASFFVGELQPTSPNVMRWPLAESFREQSRAAANALNQINKAAQNIPAEIGIERVSNRFLRDRRLAEIAIELAALEKSLAKSNMLPISPPPIAPKPPITPSPPPPPKKRRRGR